MTEEEGARHETITQEVRRSVQGQGSLGSSSRSQTISEIASRFEIHPTLIHTWKKQLVESARELFKSGNGRQVQGQEALLAKLYQQIGQLTVERDFRRGGPVHESQ